MDSFNQIADIDDNPATLQWAVKLSAEVARASGDVVRTVGAPESQSTGGQCLRMLGALRLIRNIQVCVDDHSLWLRGVGLDDQISRTLRSLPACERFLIRDDGQLVEWDESVPRRRLPDQKWQSLTHWLSIELPTPAFAGVIDQRAELRLVRSQSPADANLLRTTWPLWHDYACDAPQIRLSRLSFAVSVNREVLILGNPLPPLPGQRLIEVDRVAIPAGFRTDPQIDAKSIRLLLKLLPEEFVVYREDGSAEVVPDSAFVQATRSAVRLTAASFESPGQS